MCITNQHVKMVVQDALGLLNFAAALVDSTFHLPKGQGNIFWAKC